MTDEPSSRDRELAKDAPVEPPEGPTGVWVVYRDGATYADLPTLYLGVDEDGIHTFQLLTPRDDPIAKIGALIWPGRTSLIIPNQHPPGEHPA